MTIAQYLDQLLRSLEIDDTLRKSIVTQHRLVVRAVQSKWKGARIFYSGSYGRNTKIAPLSDVDLFLARDEEYREIGAIRHRPADLMYELEGVLQAAGLLGHGSRPQRRSMGVYQEGSWRMDLVPALRRRGGGFYIMDLQAPEPSWIFTNPEKQAEFTRQCSQLTSNRAVPLVKLTKRWCRSQHVPLRSFHVEVMVLRALNGGAPFKGFADGLVILFERLTHAVRRPCGDPGESGGRVDDYLEADKREQALRSLQAAREHLDLALAASTRDPAEAIRQMNAVFGT